MSISIKISGEKYRECTKSSKNQWCSSKPGDYGKGLGNNKMDPQKIERVSKLAELAVSMLLNTPEPEFGYLHGGDGHVDLTLYGLTIDVKCAMRKGTKNYFKGVDKRGRSTLGSDIYIFCYLSSEDKFLEEALITVVGYMTKEQVLEQGLMVPSGGWSKEKINYEIRHGAMTPIVSFLKEMGLK